MLSLEGGRNECQVPAEAGKGGRKKSFLADSGFPEGRHWLGDSPTPEALERLGGSLSGSPPASLLLPACLAWQR